MARWKRPDRPEMPDELREYNDRAWSSRHEWIRAQCTWMRENMTTAEIAEEMAVRRVARRRRREEEWCNRLNKERGR
jgi:hypothetical protein